MVLATRPPSCSQATITSYLPSWTYLSRKTGWMTPCSGLRCERHSAACLPRAGPMRCAACIRTSASIPSGIISGTLISRNTHWSSAARAVDRGPFKGSGCRPRSARMGKGKRSSTYMDRIDGSAGPSEAYSHEEASTRVIAFTAAGLRLGRPSSLKRSCYRPWRLDKPDR